MLPSMRFLAQISKYRFLFQEPSLRGSRGVNLKGVVLKVIFQLFRLLCDISMNNPSNNTFLLMEKIQRKLKKIPLLGDLCCCSPHQNCIEVSLGTACKEVKPLLFPNQKEHKLQTLACRCKVRDQFCNSNGILNFLSTEFINPIFSKREEKGGRWKRNQNLEYNLFQCLLTVLLF